MEERRWDLLVALRLYAIIFFIILPVAHVSIQLKYIQPVGVIIMGFGAWLVLKFILLEGRAASKRFLNISLAFLVFASCAIFINFLAGLFINIARDNPAGFVITLCIVLGTCIYFPAMILLHPLRGLNSRAASMRSVTSSFLKKYYLEVILICWILISIGILILPYRTHIQAPPEKAGEYKAGRMGFWTGDQFFDRERAGPGRYVSDEMLEKFGSAGVYLVYSGIRKEEMQGNMVRDFTRCREHGVEVNVSFAPSVKGYTYVNIWTFESLMGQIEEVLSFLEDNGLLGDPVTTLVYDMEPPTGRFFPLYGKDPGTIEKLREYYRLEKVFHEFNRHVREDYGLDVRICAETFQAIDPRDGDDDLISLYGVLSDDDALMSYMIYRRDDFAENYVLDSARYLERSDTIILNSWKFEGYQCWGDVECAIKDARLIAGYPGKKFNIEVWALCYFLDSFGKEGLFSFVDAVTGDRSDWPKIELRNSWPHSPLWDLAITAISLLDIYGPLFRILFHAH